MKLGEAKQLYTGQLKSFWSQKLSLAQQKKDLEEKMSKTAQNKEAFAEEAATLELQYNAVSEKYEEYKSYMEQISQTHAAYFNAEASRQQGEAMGEYAQDMAKLMEVARRISKGGIVPATDEKKLMEYNLEMYMAAKNMGSLIRQQEREKHDSLWKEEEENDVQPDPGEVADNIECHVGAKAPEIIEVADVMASAIE